MAEIIKIENGRRKLIAEAEATGTSFIKSALADSYSFEIKMGEYSVKFNHHEVVELFNDRVSEFENENDDFDDDELCFECHMSPQREGGLCSDCLN